MGTENIYERNNKACCDEIYEGERCVAPESRPRICEVLAKTTHILSEIDSRLNALLILVGVAPTDDARFEQPNDMRGAAVLNRDIALEILRKLNALGDEL